MCEVKVYRTKRGQTFLDATLQKSWTPAEAKGDSLRLVNIGLRVIEAVTLGEKISVPFGYGDEKTAPRRFEVVVKEAGEKPAAATASKLLLKPSRYFARPSSSPAAR